MKKIIAFYDVMLLAVICGPLMVCSIFIFVFGDLHDFDWTYEYWYLVILFAVGIMVPVGGSLCLRYTLITNNESIYFHYSPFSKSWKKSSNNIDIKWNQNAFISEIKNVEIVRLTEKEKQTKVCHKHCFNKYLKINLKHGTPKYVYVGNYSSCQIEKMVNIMCNKTGDGTIS